MSIRGNSHPPVLTDDKGHYELRDVAPGVYTVIAENVRFFPSVQDDVPADSTADFDLVERSYGAAAKIVYAKVSEHEAQQLLPMAKVANDHQAVFLLANRLLIEYPKDKTIAQQSHAAEAVLKSEKTTIAGSVTDPSGSVVPNAKIVLKNEVTGDTVATKTNGSGHYEASVFPVGEYTVDVAGDHGVHSEKTEWVTPQSSVTKDIRIANPR